MQNLQRLLKSLIVFQITIALGSSLQATVEPVQTGNCIYHDSRGSIDLTQVASRDGSPRFYMQEPKNPLQDQKVYSYNPCYPFDLGNDCVNSAVCASDKNDDNTTNIGMAHTAKMTYDEFYESMIIEYLGPAAIGKAPALTIVVLVCNETIDDTFEIDGEIVDNFYLMYLYSKCSCFGGCLSSIVTVTPPATVSHIPINPPQDNISFGSIVCIIFSCILVLYVIGGMIFMKFFKGARGKEVIPNVEFWQDFPNLISDGFIFVLSCGKDMGTYTAAPETPGAPSSSSSKPTTYDTI